MKLKPPKGANPKIFEGAVEVEPDGQLVLPKDDSTAEDEDTMAVDGGWYSVEDVTEDEEGADSGEDDLPIAEAGMRKLRGRESLTSEDGDKDSDYQPSSAKAPKLYANLRRKEITAKKHQRSNRVTLAPRVSRRKNPDV